MGEEEGRPKRYPRIRGGGGGSTTKNCSNIIVRGEGGGGARLVLGLVFVKYDNVHRGYAYDVQEAGGDTLHRGRIRGV